jgi:hypothetical protein
MFKIESDIEKFYQKQLKTFEELASADKVLREAAFDTVVIISDRVQQKGKKTDGTDIQSKATKKTGDYSFYYGKTRQKKGFQVDHIDLTFSGDMMGDLVPIPEGTTSYLVGFRGKKSSDVAEYNEQRFGVVFQLSPSELTFILNKINTKINEIIS